MNGFIQDTLSNSGIYAWVILPALIFIARVSDVTIGTIRLIFVSRGMKILAPIAGFFEVLIWLLVIGQVIRHMTNPMSYIGYAAGFATGNYVGIRLAEKLSLGIVSIRIITSIDAAPLMQLLQDRQFGVTCIDGYGSQGKVQIVYTVVKKAQVAEVEAIIKQFNPEAFYSIEEIVGVEKGIFPMKRSWRSAAWLRLVRPFRKGK